jgi:hypothetical protein
VESGNWGGEAVLEGYYDEEGIAQADVNLNGGQWAEICFRYANPDNFYAVRLGADTGGGSGPIDLIKVVRGKRSTLSSNTYTTAASVTVKLKVTSVDAASIWVDANLRLGNNALTEIEAGGIALAGEKARFDNVKVGYDNNADGDIDDAGDDLVANDDFGGTTITPTHDHNGNLTFDGTYRYTYDAWNP